MVNDHIKEQIARAYADSLMKQLRRKDIILDHTMAQVVDKLINATRRAVEETEIKL